MPNPLRAAVVGRWSLPARRPVSRPGRRLPCSFLAACLGIACLACSGGGGVEAGDPLVRAKATFDPAASEQWIEALLGPAQAAAPAAGVRSGAGPVADLAGDATTTQALPIQVPSDESTRPTEPIEATEVAEPPGWRGPRPAQLDLHLYARPSEGGSTAAERLALGLELQGFDVELCEAKQWRPEADQHWLGDRTLDEVRQESVGLVLVPPGCPSATELLRKSVGRGYEVQVRPAGSKQHELQGESVDRRIDVFPKRRAVGTPDQG